MSTIATRTRGIGLLAALCAALLAGGAARADDAEPAGAVALADPPGRVGRVSAVVGAVDLSQGAGAPWELARINQPVTGQTALFAPPGSQAEVRIGSTSVRLDADTQAAFSQLDDHGIAIDVAQGTVRARVRNLPTGDAFSLSADGVRAHAERPGDYRVSYDPDNGAYTVRTVAGQLRLVTRGGSYKLESGQEIVVEDGGETVRLQPPGEPDAFDAWAGARDDQQDALASARYVSPETTGIEALDEHGGWDVTEEYGAVWYPRSLPAGWAPYRYGHWAHVHPWGWTWVDDAPWGFAPFHYGRWAMIGSHWGWVPGPFVARPVWAPALVGYVGGSRLSIGIGIGAPVGWFPLGPHEIYHPPYRYSQRHWDHVNWHKRHRDGRHRDHDDWRRDDDWRAGEHERGDRRMRHHPAPGGYRYAKRPDALTVVSADSFRGSRSVAGERLPLNAGQIAQLAPMSPALRLPDSTPRFGQSGSPALRLPTPPPRGLRQRGDDPPGQRWRPGPRERDGERDRRMVARPPALERDGGRQRIPRNTQPPVQRAARSDRDPLQVVRPQADRPVFQPRPAPVLVAPDRRMTPPPAQRQPPPARAITPLRPAQSPALRGHAVQPPMQAVPGIMPRRVQPAPGAVMRGAVPTPGAARGGEQRGGGRVEAPRGRRER